MLTIPLFSRIFGDLRRWNEVVRQRRRLRDLDDEALKDLGFSRADALREANRAPWDGGPSDDPTLVRHSPGRAAEGGEVISDRSECRQGSKAF